MSSLLDHTIVAAASPNKIPLQKEDIQPMDTVLLDRCTLEEMTFVIRKASLLAHLDLSLPGKLPLVHMYPVR